MVTLYLSVDFDQVPDGQEGVLQVLQRLVPLQRGLFEDYVANFWCVSHPVFRWKHLLSHVALARLCAAATVCALLPACLHQIARPSRRGFLYTLVISSLSFFLFSYQVRTAALLRLTGSRSECLTSRRLLRWYLREAGIVRQTMCQ